MRCFLIETVKIAGYFAIVGTLSLAVFCILSIVQLAMVVSKEKVVVAYSKTVATKLVFAFAASKYIIHMCPSYILKIIYTLILWQTYYYECTRMKYLTRWLYSLYIALLAIIAAGLFALQTDDKDNSYQVTRGESFYMQVNKLNHILMFEVLKMTVFRVFFIN